ncbi:MAG: response regulator transcription factor [Verrucomicrobiota bacterium]
MRILLVEDSRHLREATATALKKSGYAVDTAADGKDGLWLAQENPYDLAILDIMLPGMDGLSILREIRKQKRDLVVLLLTARDKVDDKVEGFEAGADDYLAKPFALKELLARVNALCRRSYGQTTHQLNIGNLEVNTSKKSAQRAGKTLELTAKEYAILEFLALREGKVVSRTEIENHVYDELVSPSSNVVDRTICVLRQKITVPEGDTPLIHTKRGHGYILEARTA